MSLDREENLDYEENNRIMSELDNLTERIYNIEDKIDTGLSTIKKFIILLSLLSLSILCFSNLLCNKVFKNEEEIGYLKTMIEAKDFHFANENLKLKNLTENIQNEFQEKIKLINNKLNDELENQKKKYADENEILENKLKSIQNEITTLNENKIDFEILDEKGEVILDNKKEKIKVDIPIVNKDLDNTLTKKTGKSSNNDSEENDSFYNRILSIFRRIF